VRCSVMCVNNHPTKSLERSDPDSTYLTVLLINVLWQPWRDETTVSSQRVSGGAPRGRTSSQYDDRRRHSGRGS